MNNTNNISNLNDNIILYDKNRNVNLENNLTVEGDTYIKGNLNVDGHIDPESIELIPQTEAPLDNEGTIYYDSNNSEFRFRENGNWRTLSEQDEWNKRQDIQLQDHENRINKLEETQVNIMGEIEFIREKNKTVSVYSKYDVRHSGCPEVGLKCTIGIGKSWVEKEMNKINKRLNELERR